MCGHPNQSWSMLRCQTFRRPYCRIESSAIADLDTPAETPPHAACIQSIRLGFNYRLGENGGIDPQVFTKGISALDLGWFALHGQTTFVSQKRGIAETAEYQGNWTLRGGLFDLSMVPNSTDLDPHFG